MSKPPLMARKWFRRAVWGFVALMALGGAGWGGIAYTSRSEFCGTCHIMEPYVASWKSGPHGGVECVACHFPPGVGEGLKAKWQASSQLIKYVTGTYSSRPWGKVEDASCLRSGCHAVGLIETAGGFSHGAHLRGEWAGLRLHCTSCHTQLDASAHIALEPLACHLCHRSGTTGCTSCHATSTVKAERYDHRAAARVGAPCASCHAESTGGRTFAQACRACHLQPPARDTPPERLHALHSGRRYTPCRACHDAVDHAPGVGTATAMECGACHAGMVEAVTAFAADDAMFAAGVRCAGCHAEHAAPVSVYRCAACHGAAYSRSLTGWRAALDHWKGLVDADLKASPNAAAQARLEALRRGGPAHNPARAVKEYAAIRAELKQASGAPDLPIPASDCVKCHADIALAEGTIWSGQPWVHRPHVEQGMDCTACHTPYEQHGRTTATVDTCTICHQE